MTLDMAGTDRSFYDGNASMRNREFSGFLVDCSFVAFLSVASIALLILTALACVRSDSPCLHETGDNVKAYFNCACSCDACRNCTGVTVD